MVLSFDPLRVFLPIGLLILAVAMATLVVDTDRDGCSPSDLHPTAD